MNSRSSLARAAARSLLRFCGSVQLAMLLLAVLILACVFGTITESKFDSAVARAYFYDAPWFLAWLIVLCVNLIGAVVVRYPWKARHVGFIITHAGIVVMLAGAMVGRIWGIEGTVTLFKDREPANFLMMDQTVLTAKASETAKAKAIAIDMELRPPTRERPQKLTVEDCNIAVVGAVKELGIRMAARPTGGSNGTPAVRLALRNKAGGIAADHWLLLGERGRDRAAFGPANVEFVPEPSRAVAGNLPRELEKPAASAKARPAAVFREKHFVFSKMPDLNVVRSMEGDPTGLQATLRASEANFSESRLELKGDGKHFEFTLEEVLKGALPLEGTSWTLHAAKYFPDFRMEGTEAVSVSDQPRNPALRFEIAGTVSRVTHGGECDHSDHANHDAERCKGEQHACCNKESTQAGGHTHGSSGSQVTIYYGPDGTLRYAVNANGKRSAEGPLRVGGAIATGEPDWQLHVERLLDHAVMGEEFAPWADGLARAGTSGVLVEVRRNGSKTEQWIPAGDTTVLEVAGRNLRLEFGYRIHSLGFNVGLKEFQVDRDEGSQSPSGFKSLVTFSDPKTARLERREIWMNHPANFPDFFGAGLLGTSFKFSQASWNPNNLNQTTLQVLRDPGWSLKWIGSLLLCGGLFTMFYLKPHSRTQPRNV